MPKISSGGPPTSITSEPVQSKLPTPPKQISKAPAVSKPTDTLEKDSSDPATKKQDAKAATLRAPKAANPASKAKGPGNVPTDLANSVALLSEQPKIAAPKLSIESKSLSKSEMTCRFYPRINGKAAGVVRNQDTGLFSQGNTIPGFKAARGAQKDESKALESAVQNCSCLVHGIGAQWIGATLERGSLISGYALRGPKGNYSRDADRNGGGATGVYTRAVGTKQKKWAAQGFGVGSNAARVQMVLSPEILQNQDHCWRASTMDGMGKLPGVTKGLMKQVVTERSGTDAFHAWEQQSEKDRNYQFNSAVKGNTLENNEQIHWENIPLDQSLAALVCDPEALSELLPLCHTNADGNHFIAFAGREIPVITASKTDHLLSKLSERGVTNPKGQVRLNG